MASVGEGLLFKILAEGRKTEFASLPSSFFKQHEIPMYEYIRNYLIEYGELPGLGSFVSRFNIDPDTIDNTYGYYYEETRKRSLFFTLSDLLSEVSELLSEQKVDEARLKIASVLSSTEVAQAGSSTNLYTLSMLGEMVLDYIRQNRFAGGVTGIPTGWPTFDSETSGLQREDVYIIAGRPEKGKTTILLHMSENAFLEGYTPLFISMEMSSLKIAKRFFAKRAGIPSDIMKRGLVSTFGERRIIADINRVKQRQPFFFVEGQLQKQIEEIEMLIQNIRPHVVFIDGAYLIRTEQYYRQSWEKIAEIARRLKVIAEKAGVPVVATFQMNRSSANIKVEEAGIEHLQLSDALGQIASVVLGIFDSPPEDRDMFDYDAPFRYIGFLKGREGERGGFLINWDWNNLDFSEIERRFAVEDS